MPRVLGLDIGSTSIGWALLDGDTGEVEACGVRVFPEGVDRDQRGGEQSKSAARRVARGMRRQIARRARRKQQLRRLLDGAGLLPAAIPELDSLWNLEPLALRVRALSERLEPHEFGRLLIHLNQRRGFKSNRKGEGDKEQKGLLQEINDHEAKMKADGSRTLGEYLSSRHVARVDARGTPMARVRGLHTRRSMFEQEFDAVWGAQAGHHAGLLTTDLRDQVRDLIFFQRPLKPPPKWLVGRCELDPTKKRCPRAERPAQRFRILQEVNNLALIDRATGEVRSLTDGERAIVVELLSKKERVAFDDIRKKLGFPESVRFNLEGPERKKLKGHETDYKLAGKGNFGKAWWALPEPTKDLIVRILIEETDEAKTVERLVKEAEVDPGTAGRIAPLNFPEGYASYCRETIERLLPHLARGLKMMGNDPSDSALHAAGFLRPDERAVKTHGFLPPPPTLTNPIVRQAMFEVRKVVNAIIREYGRPDIIRVELVREAKMSFKQREQMRIDNADRQRARDAARAEIEKRGFPANGKTIERWVLWQEQREECVYTGRMISPEQLLGGEVHVDHILPRNRSLDNSKMNKVVCFRDANADKGDRTPREWLEASDPKRYEEVLQRADRLPFRKTQKFGQKEIVLDEFIARQLVDTAYISRSASQYLRCLGTGVETQRGQMTADLRRLWGLNKILGGEDNRKTRDDHRHHAVDAIVVALTDKKRLHALANGNLKRIDPPSEGFRDRVAEKIKAIIVSHRARRKVCGALHKEMFSGATQKRAGPDAREPGSPERAHAKGWVEKPGTFVQRCRVDTLDNLAQVHSIRDPTIRNMILEHLRPRGVDITASKGPLPKDAFTGANAPKMPSGVPIKKVRLIEVSKTLRPVSERRSFQFVDPDSNHHVTYRESIGKKGESWTGTVMPMWDAAKLASSGQQPIDRSDRDGRQFLFSLSIGETIEIDDGSGKRMVCVIRKISRNEKGDARLYYKAHTDARPATEKRPGMDGSAKKLRELNAKKISVDPLGRVRNAND